MAEPLIWPLSFPTSTTTIKGADASIALLSTLMLRIGGVQPAHGRPTLYATQSMPQTTQHSQSTL